MPKSQCLVIIDQLPLSTLRSIELLNKQGHNLEAVVLSRDAPSLNKRLAKFKPTFNIKAVDCQFNDDQAIKAVLGPYTNRLAGVICRSDKRIQYMRRVVDLLPPGVPVASAQALLNSTDKQLMRQAFLEYDPTITPKFMAVNHQTAASLKAIEATLAYPLLLKPANLASSLLIHLCRNRAELQGALESIFSNIQAIYLQEERRDKPQIIAEEYLEGAFYSIDAYVLDQENIFCCPPVSYIPAQQIGVDDFFIYKRTLPTSLTSDQLQAANATCLRAIKAVGLTYSSAHVELVLTKDGWRIIELGPRIGRFRHQLYGLAYGLDHSTNDVRISLNLPPIIPTKLINYAAAYSLYPQNEGHFLNFKGLEVISKSPNCRWLQTYVKNAEVVKLAKNGGHALAELIIASKDQASLNELISQIESEVSVETS